MEFLGCLDFKIQVCGPRETLLRYGTVHGLPYLRCLYNVPQSLHVN